MSDIQIVDSKVENFERRLTSIEQNHLAIQKDVTTLTADIASLVTSIKTIDDNVKNLSRRQTDHYKTNWATIASWAGVLLIILGLVIYQPLQEIKTSVHSHTHDGHPQRIDQQVSAYERAIILRTEEVNKAIDDINDKFGHLDTTLQREMRLLDDTTKQQVTQLDQRLQQEMRMLNATQDQQIKAIEKILDGINEWMITHIEQTTRIDQRQSTTIESLEQQASALVEQLSVHRDQILPQSTKLSEHNNRILTLERAVLPSIPPTTK